MLYANSEEDHESAVNEIQQCYVGKTSILNIVNDIAKDKLHYAKFSLERSEGTLGKVSNNPAEQNHSSIVYWVGEKLYDEPGFEIKKLLGRQKTLEDKRNGEKGDYYFEIQAERATNKELLADEQLSKAKLLLDKKSFQLWSDEKKQSTEYTCTTAPSGCRKFVCRGYEHSPRIVPVGARCTCKIRVMYLMQCRHEICESRGRLREESIDP